MSAPTLHAKKPLARRVRLVLSLVLVGGLVGSSTSCAQIIGVNKDYKKGVQVPKTWYCDNSYYDEVGAGKDPADAYCDCACGAYDPDCDEELEEDIALVSDHTDPKKDPEGDTANPNCKVCLEDEDADEGSVCALTRD